MTVTSRLIIPLALCLGLVSCGGIPQDAFKLSESSLQERNLQSRRYDTTDEASILSAGIGVMQDMGYSIDTIAKDAGLLTASKTVDATDGGQVAASIFVALMGGGNIPIDKEQKIKASLVSTKAKNNSDYIVRVTFQRLIWNTEGKLTKAETLNEPEMFVEFFDKLSKSVFLEANQL